MGLDTQRIWGLPVGMTVATAGSTFIYKKTGNIWLCALLVGTIACIMGRAIRQHPLPLHHVLLRLEEFGGNA